MSSLLLWIHFQTTNDEVEIYEVFSALKAFFWVYTVQFWKKLWLQSQFHEIEQSSISNGISNIVNENHLVDLKNSHLDVLVLLLTHFVSYKNNKSSKLDKELLKICFLLFQPAHSWAVEERVQSIEPIQLEDN